jgi:restriction endonuclease S subunit
MLNTPYKLARFDEVFKRVKRPLILEDAVEYNCVGLQLYGRGAYVRENKLGGTISRKQQWIVKKDDVLYNKLFAWKGTFAIADASVDGCIASDKFPIYRFDPNVICADYLRLWFKSPFLATQAESYSKGAAALSKLTLNPPDFWKLAIPLPSLDEQRVIAQKTFSILNLITSVEHKRRPLDAVIHGRRAGIGSQVRLLLDFALSELNSTFGHDLKILDTILLMRPRSGPSFVVSEEGTGIPVVMPSATLGYRYNSNKCLYGLGGEILKPNDILEDGDLLITRGNYRDQVGICVLYAADATTRTYANLIMRMKVNREIVIPDFVKYWIMSPMCVRYIRQHTKGTSPSVQKINQRALIAMPFPQNVSFAEQSRWVQRLDRLFNEVENLERVIRDQYISIGRFKMNALQAAFEGRIH